MSESRENANFWGLTKGMGSSWNSEWIYYNYVYIYVCFLYKVYLHIYIYMIYTPRVGNRKQGQSKEQMGYCIYGTIAIAFQMLVSSLNPFTLPRSMVVTLNSWINPDATKTANFVLYMES